MQSLASFQDAQILSLLPILVLFGTGLIVMLADLFLPGKEIWPHTLLSMLGLALAGFLTLVRWQGAERAFDAYARSASMLSPESGEVLSIITPLLQVDRFGLFVLGTLIMTALILIALSYDYLQSRAALARSEYFVIILMATGAMGLLAMASDLVLIFLTVETFSIALYVLCGFPRDERRPQESALKYFLLGAFSAGFLLYGISLVYAATGTTNLLMLEALNLNGALTNGPLLMVGLALILIGFGFKISMVPFHQWTPDVYQGAPLSVTAFMSAATKAAAFAALLRILWTGFLFASPAWTGVLAVLAVATMLVGNIFALLQSDLKRMLGFSAVGHAGYLIVALIAGPLGQGALLFYLLYYALMNLGAFGVLMSIGAKDESAGHGLDDLKGLSSRHGGLALCMAIFLISLTGLPPTAGFLGKWYIFQAAIGSGWVWLAAIMIVASVLSAFAYLRPIVYMYMVDAEDSAPAIQVGTLSSISIAISALMVGAAVLLSGRMVGAAQASVIGGSQVGLSAGDAENADGAGRFNVIVPGQSNPAMELRMQEKANRMRIRECRGSRFGRGFNRFRSRARPDGAAMSSPLNTLDRCQQIVDGSPYPLRPTFCNIPHWAEITLYVMSVVAIAIFAYGIYRHWHAWMAGQSEVPDRNKGREGRLRNLLKYSFAQRKTVERRFPGFFHSGMYIGFVLLFIGTALATIDWDVTRLLFGASEDALAGRILRGEPYKFYEFILDTAGLVFLIGLVLAIWRRYVQAPHHVKGSWDFMLWSLVLINVSGFLVEALRIVLTPHTLPWANYSWLGNALAGMFTVAFGSKGPALEFAASSHLWLWLLHGMGSLFFVAALPYTNAVHMFTVSANAFFRSKESIGAGAALQPIDLENAEVWGVGKLADLNWKQRLSVDSCVRCGRCETVCPAYMSGTPLNPKQIIVSLSGQLREEVSGPFIVDDSSGEIMVGQGLLIEPDALWACTTCMACVEICPAFIEIVDDIVDMRRYLTLNEGALPGTSSTTLRNMGQAGNPWGYSQEDRLGWAEGLEFELPIAEAGQHYDVLYWVGCSASYDQRNQKIARSLVQLMQKAGVKFAVMREESCTCESARRLGDEYLYQTATELNLANMQQYTFDRVVCHCPHCFNTIRNEYPQFGGDFEVVHHSQLLSELVDAGRLSAASTGASDGSRVVFHDSCYLGRYNDIFDAPRQVLDASGAIVLEPDRGREKGLCCGGGGGKMWFEGEADRDVNLIRMEELLESKPDSIGVACPFCLTMMDDAAKSLGAENVKVRDIAEVLVDQLG